MTNGGHGPETLLSRLTSTVIAKHVVDSLQPKLSTDTCGARLDGVLGSGAEPVAVGREAEGVNDIICLQAVQLLSILQVPQHRRPVLRRWFSLEIFSWIPFQETTSIYGTSAIYPAGLSIAMLPCDSLFRAARDSGLWELKEATNDVYLTLFAFQFSSYSSTM